MKSDFAKQYPKVWFVGIGGISMSGLAQILKSRGVTVAGSDIHPSEATHILENSGIPVVFHQVRENLTADWDLVVYTAAVKQNNPELMEARSRNIPIMERAELLGLIMAEYPKSIGIAGTHGKTTTTSMVSHILLAADTDPTISVGGILPIIHGNTRVGGPTYFVAEACEYCDSFLHLAPYIGVILNVEEDHLDYFQDLKQIQTSFRDYAAKLPADGALILNNAVQDQAFLTSRTKARVITYGTEAADWTAVDIAADQRGNYSFNALYRGTPMGRVILQVPGAHNVGNALAACAAAYACGVSMEAILQGLKNFGGTDRRFQYKGNFNGAQVVDDYAHHPTEIAATLAAAAKIPHQKLWCVFQPHTYSRTLAFLDDFAKALSAADHVVLADIYAARETDDGSIHSKDLAQRIKSIGTACDYFGDFSRITDYLCQNISEGDLVITMGAGDIFLVGEALISR